MKKIFILSISILNLMFFNSSFSLENNEFELYKPDAPLDGKPRTPLLKTSNERNFRTRLKEASAEGPNFNGHFKITWWGCGTNCIDWAVINLQTGETLMQNLHESCWPYKATEEDPDPENAPDWFEFNISSSLLYSYTCEDYEGNVTFDTRLVYMWQGNNLKLLRKDKVSY